MKDAGDMEPAEQPSPVRRVEQQVPRDRRDEDQEGHGDRGGWYYPEWDRCVRV